VGYELYLELLEKTVSELKGEKQEDAVDPEMNVPVSAFLPEAFVPDAEQRLLAYKRLATASEEAVVDELATEWRDRYGILPQTVRNLLLLKKIRLLLARLRIVRVDADQQGFLLRFAAHTTLHAEELLNICAKRPQLLQLAPDYKLLVRVVGPEMGERLTKLRIVLQELLEHGTNGELI
jgi:transcription-repair coupling factor (superfamily II helicase)